MTRRLTLMLALFASVALTAQEQRYVPISPLPLGDTLLSLPTVRIPSTGTWEVKFTHRFNQSIDEGEAIHSLFGLDSNADVGIGLSFAPRRDLQFSLLRSNAMDDIELAAKYMILQQAPAIPFSSAVRVGVDVRTERDLEDRVSYFGQLILARQFGRRAEIFALPTYVTNAGRAVTGETSGALFENAFNVPVGFAIMLRPGLSVCAEVIPTNRDLPDALDADFSWAIGVKRAIGGHYFEILLTNNQSSLVDQYTTSTYQGAPLNRGDIKLGFNIERRFGRRR